MRCLIVDDSADFRDAARSMLGRAGFEIVALASNSSEALTYARELRPDVALVDIDLGGESGFDLAEALTDAESPTEVILVSTYAEQDLAEMIAVSPAVGFISKLELSAPAIRDLVEGQRASR